MKIYIILILDIHVFTLLRIEHSATKTDFGSGYHQRYFQTIYYCYTHELHSCPDSCRINQFHISTHVLDPETSYVPHDVFAQNHLHLSRQNKCCTHIRLVFQAKQTNCDKPQIISNKKADPTNIKRNALRQFKLNLPRHSNQFLKDGRPRMSDNLILTVYVRIHQPSVPPANSFHPVLAYAGNSCMGRACPV